MTTMSLVEMRKGLHLRGPDLRGCVGCDVGAYAVRRLKKLAADKVEAEKTAAASLEPKRWIKPVRP